LDAVARPWVTFAACSHPPRGHRRLATTDRLSDGPLVGSTSLPGNVQPSSAQIDSWSVVGSLSPYVAQIARCGRRWPALVARSAHGMRIGSYLSSAHIVRCGRLRFACWVAVVARERSTVRCASRHRRQCRRWLAMDALLHGSLVLRPLVVVVIGSRLRNSST
jgi:hypothetical protein